MFEPGGIVYAASSEVIKSYNKETGQEETIYTLGSSIKGVSVLDGNLWFVGSNGLQIIGTNTTIELTPVTIQHNAICATYHSIHIKKGKVVDFFFYFENNTYRGCARNYRLALPGP